MVNGEQVVTPVRQHDQRGGRNADKAQPAIGALVASKQLPGREAAKRYSCEHDGQHDRENEAGAVPRQQQEAKPHDLERQHQRTGQECDRQVAPAAYVHDLVFIRCRRRRRRLVLLRISQRDKCCNQIERKCKKAAVQDAEQRYENEFATESA